MSCTVRFTLWPGVVQVMHNIFQWGRPLAAALTQLRSMAKGSVRFKETPKTGKTKTTKKANKSQRDDDAANGGDGSGDQREAKKDEGEDKDDADGNGDSGDVPTQSPSNMDVVVGLGYSKVKSTDAANFVVPSVWETPALRRKRIAGYNAVRGRLC